MSPTTLTMTFHLSPATGSTLDVDSTDALHAENDAIYKFNRSCVEVQTVMDEADALDPRSYTYDVLPDGRLTASSVRLWRQRTDDCYKTYKLVLQKLKEARKHKKKLKRLGLPCSIDSTDIRGLETDIARIMKLLKAQRSRVRI